MNKNKNIPGVAVAVLLLIVVGIYIYRGNKGKSSPTSVQDIEKAVRSPTTGPRTDGVAVAILIDTSGSMSDPVKDADGRQVAKFAIAQRCLSKIAGQLEGAAKEQPGQPLLLGIYEFSARGRSSFRKIVPMGKPDARLAQQAMSSVRPDGQTPIGDTMIQAKKDLDATRLSRLHILVITDGENNVGATPENVVSALAKLPEEQRPGVYFVAFDVAAKVFEPVKKAGALVLPATNEKELQEQLDFIVGNKILLEK